ncbi:MAG: 3-keto-disaccharide hydrolase [Bacteroidota bacterium]
MKKGILFLATGALLALISCSDTKKNSGPNWQYLYNGQDLSGFVQRGGEALFEAKDSLIVGTTVWGTPNSFLCTEDNYQDFILELEFKVAPEMNSGVQIRSNSDPDYRNGRVHGYQVEIDPSQRAYTGGIFDESRMGWLYPLNAPENEEARMAFKPGDWNHFRVEAIGNRIKTWLNDVPVANLVDEMTDSGFIALQVHSINDSAQLGEQIMWKNIRILTENPDQYSQESPALERSYLINELTQNEKEQGWKLLFDGETSEGWRKAHDEEFPEFGWIIEDGVLTVVESGGAESQHGGDIVTVDEYSDFDLRLQVKYTKGANSGIKYFVTEKEKTKGSAIGLEYQILDDFTHPDAKLGNHPGSRTLASLYDLIKAENKRRNGIEMWNNVRIVSDGMQVEHWLNGFKVLEYERGSEEFRKLVEESKYANWENFGEAEEGHILLQDHGDRVSFRSIKILEPNQ